MSNKLVFTTPCSFNHEEFGCASFGFADAPDPTDPERREFPIDLEGEAYYGMLDDILKQIPEKGKNGKWQAGIVLFANCGRENEFVHKLSEKVKCPLVGGAAAINPVNGMRGLIAGGWDVAVYMICDPKHKVTVETKNIHDNMLGMYEIEFTDPRVADSIEGEDALYWYMNRRAEYGFGENDFEHMTFSDENNVNVHLSSEGGRLVAGRDLCRNMILRCVDTNVYEELADFYNDPDAIVFGCAGLKGILEKDLNIPGTGLFMFGEVVTMKNGVSEFGNLMLTKLVVR